MVKLKGSIHKKICLLAACIWVLLLLSACNNKEVPIESVENCSYPENAISTGASVPSQPTEAPVRSSAPSGEPLRYQQGQRPRYVEPYGTRAYADDKGVWTELHGIRYSFPLSVEQEQRDSLVRDTDAEYAHYLLDNTGIPYSNEHTVCYYISERIPLGMDGKIEILKWSVDTHSSEYKEIWDMITQDTGRELNLSKKEDIWVLMQVPAANRKDNIEMALTDSHTGDDMYSKSAFVLYLALQYGEDEMLDALLADAPQNLGYDSWEEAAQEWDIWVKQYQ